MIGTRAVGQSAPDGYTLLFNGTASIVRDGFDPRSAVDHIARAAITHNILVVNQHVPVSNVNEFINYLRARPGHLNHGTAGPLTSQHLAAVMFDLMAETKMENVHYRGTGPSVAGILSNEVQVNEGKLKALAPASERRSIQMPTLPRVADFIPGYGAELTYSYCTPIGTPQSILRKLENAVGEAVRDPALINSLQTRGFEPAFESGESLTRAIDQDMRRWADVLKKAGIDLNQA
jgi:tripartite-type tricarboxylate transporter receptor subunit TctC